MANQIQGSINNYTDEDFIEFTQTDNCRMCGTQRCMADLETLHEIGPCMSFIHYLENKRTTGINITQCF